MNSQTNPQPLTQKHLDQSLEKFTKTLNKNLDDRFEEQAQTILEAMDFGFQEVKEEIKTNREEINKTKILIDNYVKTQEDFKEEFIILKAEVDKIKEVIKNKLGIEIRAL